MGIALLYIKKIAITLIAKRKRWKPRRTQLAKRKSREKRTLRWWLIRTESTMRRWTKTIRRLPPTSRKHLSQFLNGGIMSCMLSVPSLPLLSLDLSTFTVACHKWSSSKPLSPLKVVLLSPLYLGNSPHKDFSTPMKRLNSWSLSAANSFLCLRHSHRCKWFLHRSKLSVSKILISPSASQWPSQWVNLHRWRCSLCTCLLSELTRSTTKDEKL